MNSIISWNDFLNDIEEIKKYSDKINDDWELITETKNIDASKYLKKKMKYICEIPQNIEINLDNDINEYCDISSINKTHNIDILCYEYHLIYNISYQVPVLCFNAIKSNGSLLSLEESWKLFNKNNPECKTLNMGTVLTQMEHPILFKPFLTLHPCRTAEILSNLPDSKNKVLSFLSAIGPAVNLNMNLLYGNL